MNLKNTLFLLALVTVLWSCGDDDESPTLITLDALEGDWSTLDWETGPSGNEGLLAMTFTASTADGEITALSPNAWGFTCNEVTIRNLVPRDANSFSCESLIRFTSGSSEWVPGSITVENADQIAISSDCAGCSNDVLTLNRTTGSTTASVIIGNDILQPLTLTKVNCESNAIDYLITDWIDVEEVLTIEPGVNIAFAANAGFFVNDILGNGALVAVGTSSEPITFTGEQQTKGFWRGISVQSNDVRNELNYVILEYAGSDPISSFAGIDIKGGVSIDGASGFSGSLKVNNSIIRDNDGNGLIVEEGTLLREFSNNEFENNTEAAVRIDANNVGAIDGDSDFIGSNGVDGVEINATGSSIHDITDDATWPALADGAVYRVVQSFDVRAQLTIMPGAVIEFDANQTMYFEQDFSGPNDGIIIAKGTSTNPITFTGVAKTPGYWQGLVIQSNSVLNEMDYCIVEYGGSDVVADQAANIVLDKDGAFADPDLIVTNSTIRNSAGCGIVVDQFGGNLTQSGNTFSTNPGGNICD